MEKTRKLCECAIVLALSVVLSFVEIFRLPMGGGVTLLSMLPILLLGTKRGLVSSISVSVLYALFQLAQAFMNGNVFIYCQSGTMVILCILFDYLLPFGLLGLSGITNHWKNKLFGFRLLGFYALLIFIRFLCHFITGFAIWGQWAPEGMGKFLYSFIYNIQFMGPELILTVFCAAVLFRISSIRKYLSGES